jgi:hypothetical protein
LTVINFVCCVVVFYGFYRFSADGDKLENAFPGWIAWLGLICAGPNFFSNTTRAKWFCKEHGPGTVILLLVNVIAAIGGNAMAYSLVK